MNSDSFPIPAARLHVTGSSALIAQYHRVRQVSGRGKTQTERDDAARSARLIARELLTRGVRV